MSIRELEQKIFALLTESKISIDVIELILKDVLVTVQNQVNMAYAAAATEAAKKEEEKKGGEPDGE
jgi:hypothetical protein